MQRKCGWNPYSGGILLHTLHAHSGPVAQPKNMSLVFDYHIGPAERAEITFVKFNASPTDGCTFYHGSFQEMTKGFTVTVWSHTPVSEMTGTASIYGIRYNDW
ncbi:uncharacterized protein LOC134205953 isoform X2 [Armigeres subalbatus]|uniref:uncharacterized protein LOC134205953 isoform X2 n=1 Tax=Armigeres subalbatus TaxID=124917 RepID=UPI002ED17CFF